MNIEFYSDDRAVVEHFPPKPANKVVPEWYKEMPLRRKARLKRSICLLLNIVCLFKI